MVNYHNYEIEDFLQDDFFIDWVYNRNTESNAFWNKFLLDHPDKSIVLEKARAILISISVTPLADQLSDLEFDTRIKLLQAMTLDVTPRKEAAHVKIYQSRWFQIAATFLIFLSIAFISYKVLLTPNKPHSQALMSNLIKINNIGTKARVVLMDDGSLAILNPGSEIQVPRKFTGKERSVYLQGEAFFEVHKDHLHPFLVHSQNMITRVLGTSFTVKAFKNDPTFKVTVNTGKVWVYDQKTNPIAEKKNLVIALIPNQQVIFTRKILQFRKDTIVTPLLLSKEVANKELTFENAPFSAVIEKLNKAYGIQIEYNKQTLGSLRITAALADHPLNEKVEMICRAVNAKYSFTDGRIIIEEDGQNLK
ncbi:MAG: FecR family protein [Mucilaginibacter sp.]|nr:FecR family protein [Mucilaginibacter sp.]